VDENDRSAADRGGRQGGRGGEGARCDSKPRPQAPPTDPASIAKQNLLDRIRAARANATDGQAREMMNADQHPFIVRRSSFSSSSLAAACSTSTPG